MDSTLVMIAALAVACSFVIGVLLHMLLVYIMGKRAKHTDAEAAVAKWLESRERQVTELTRLRSEVQRLSNDVSKAAKSDGKDTYKQLERIKQLEDGLEWAYEHIDALEAALKEPIKPTNGYSGGVRR